MNSILSVFTIQTLVLLLVATNARGQLEWRVSVKFITTNNGIMPMNGGWGTDLTNEQAVINNINFANQILDKHGRGYRLRLTEIRRVIGWENFYDLPARNSGNKNALESAAKSNPAEFFWRDDAINVYINNTRSGICSIPPFGGDAIFIGSQAYDTLMLHEIGHFFDLFHTHNGESGCVDNCGCGETLEAGDDDSVDDTLPDHECYSREQIAARSPGATDLQIDNVWFNIMSYHPSLDRFTSSQLDRATDASNAARNQVATGRSWFVDRNAGCFAPNGHSHCHGLAGPFPNIAGGVNAANPGGIVLIRPGNYNEPQTITKAVTFRATRGTAVIGKP